MNKIDKFLCFLIFPALISGQIAQVTGIFLFIVLKYIYILLLIFRLPSYKLKVNKQNIISSVFLVIICAGILRTNGTLFTAENNFLEVVFYLVTYLFFLGISINRNSIKFIFMGLFGILLFNILLMNLGIQNVAIYKVSSESSAVVLSKLFPISDFKRLLFPISNGVNNYGVQIGLLSLFFLLQLKQKYYLIFACITTVSLLFCDTRSSILIIALLLVIKFYKSYKSVLLRVSCLIILLAIPILFQNLSRDSANSSDFKTLNSRSLIWSYAILKVPNLTLPETVFGLGRFSAQPLGVSRSIDDDYVSDSDYISFHNNFFQFYFDWGVVGLFFMLFLFYWTLIKSKNIENLPYIILYLILVGFTEASVSYHYTPLLIIFLFIVVYLEAQTLKIPLKNPKVANKINNFMPIHIQ